MSIFKDTSDKTEDPTPKRIEEAADKGQVAQSRELVAAGVVLSLAAALAMAGPALWRALGNGVRSGLEVHRVRQENLDDPTEVSRLVHTIAGDSFWAALTFVGVVVVTVLFLATSQVGIRFRPKTLRVDFSRLSPAKNIQKLFRPTALIRALVAIAQIAAAVIVIHGLVDSRIASVTLLGSHTTDSSLGLVASTLVDALVGIGLVSLFIGVFDFGWQKFDHKKQLRMSKREVDDERKNTEGDPLIRSRLRRAAQELAKRRMMEAVPKADVVITNPTHYAVALKYERGESAAPEVVAKGADEVAARIREIARENNVPLMEDPPLARGLFAAVKVGEQIPERFYHAVATVLGYVLKARDHEGAPA